jgi:creatinine amidohydrolase
MENFPWNRVTAAPSGQKSMVDYDKMRTLGPAGVRDLLGDGNFGGEYEKPDEQMLAIWAVAVAETRALIESI